jgi:hypothetical protein
MIRATRAAAATITGDVERSMVHLIGRVEVGRVHQIGRPRSSGILSTCRRWIGTPANLATTCSRNSAGSGVGPRGPARTRRAATGSSVSIGRKIASKALSRSAQVT